MLVSRRTVLKGVAAGAAAVLAPAARAREKVQPSADAVGMLYDATRCVGCRACVAACKEANHLPVDDLVGDDGPSDLGPTTKSVVKTIAVGSDSAFVKQQCMHCVDPPCVSVCMLGALHKEGQGKRNVLGEERGTGIVLYDRDLCVGCRYCQIACAFGIPRFEWRKPFPEIVKCELCHHRADRVKSGLLAVANPACCEVCPADAVVYGKRADLLAEAKRRITAEPGRYNERIYGETENGGTQVLVLAGKGVAFPQLGLPDLPAQSSAQFSESVSHAPYVHGVTPIALYAAAALLIGRNRRKQEERAREEQEGSK